MIELRTGLPGAGKTLLTIVEVTERARKEKRPIYYSGIRDLVAPGWVEFGRVVDEARPHLTDASEWYKLPKGAIIVIDECQRLFRPRHFAREVPAEVASLETHRHQGHDLVLITQDPRIVDANVRRLVGRHVHTVRAFGAAAATLHEFPEVREDPQSRSDSQRRTVSFPKDAYKLFRSAEVHTHKLRIPRRVFVMAGIPLVVLALGWVVWSSMARLGDPSRIAGHAKVLAPPGVAASDVRPGGDSRKAEPLSVAQYVASFEARVPGLAYTAPAFDSVTTPQVAPVPVGCVSRGEVCRCYSQQGTRLDVPVDLCRGLLERGFFRSFEDRAPQTRENGRRDALSVPGGVGPGSAVSLPVGFPGRPGGHSAAASAVPPFGPASLTQN